MLDINTMSDIKTKKDTEVNRIIFGKNDTENIVSIAIEEDGAHIYKSDGTHEIIDYSPWALSNVGYNKSRRLKGNQYYKFITNINIERYNELKEEWDRSKWLPRSLEEGFMLLHGYTYFKGLKTDQISLLSFDIEATTLDPNDELAKVLLISTTYRDRSGKLEKNIFDLKKYKNEMEMIIDWVKYVNRLNPDVMLGHNILGYDLPYLNARSQGLYLGRDQSKVRFDSKVSKKRKDGSQSYDYFNAKIHGREIVDTLFLSINYDIGRSFPSYGLKAIEKHLKLVSDDRIEWNFEKYQTKQYLSWSDEIWAQFIKYCSDDSDSPIKMFDTMIPPFFYLNQSIPKTLQQMVNEATGSQLDAMMIRSYLQDGFSQPVSSKKSEFQGAISMGVPGVYKNVRKVDVASLYPSIMLQYDIYDKQKDPNRHMLKALEYFRAERLKNKDLGAKGSKYHQNLSDSQKVAINSLYGFLGAGFLLYNYPKGAADVTRYGREILQKGVEWATGARLVEEIKNIRNEGKENEEEKYHWILGPKRSDGKGFTLVNVDTDSFSYCVTDGELSPFAKRQLHTFNSYAEYSYSGTGVHILGKSDIKFPAITTIKNGHSIEIYSQSRYFVVTGKHVEGTPEEIADISLPLSYRVSSEQVEQETEQNEISIQEVIEMLSYIPGEGLDYNEWLRILMSVHSQFPGSDGFAAVSSWTGKYCLPNELEQKWKSFRAGGVGIGTLVYFAKEYGYSMTNNNNTTKLVEQHIDRIKPALTPIQKEQVQRTIELFAERRAWELYNQFLLTHNNIDIGYPQQVIEHLKLGYRNKSVSLDTGEIIPGAITVPYYFGDDVVAIEFREEEYNSFTYDGQPGLYHVKPMFEEDNSFGIILPDTLGAISTYLSGTGVSSIYALPHVNATFELPDIDLYCIFEDGVPLQTLETLDKAGVKFVKVRSVAGLRSNMKRRDIEKLAVRGKTLKGVI